MRVIRHLCIVYHLLCFFLVFLVLHAPSSAQPVFYTDLANDTPVFGSLPANATAYYRFVSPAVAYQQTALVSVAAELGFPSLYVSLSNAAPSATAFDYFASWQTGGVVSIVQQQPPYTAYIAVTASPYSRCNYTVLVTAYDSSERQTTPVLLSEAEPVASAIAAGEYRYFTYAVMDANVSSATISLTETYGQSWLLVNPPNTSALPTIEQSQYSSVSANFPLVALSQPAAGTWTIGVWSNASSAFAIIASAATRTQPMQLGIAYPGFALRGSPHYYSIYIDPLLRTNSSGSLDLELYRLSGYIDLYCSDTVTQPSRSSSSWSSRSTGARQSIVIPAAELETDTIYCAVDGYMDSTYIFSTLFGGGPATELTPGETLMVQSALGSTLLFSLIFPATAYAVSFSIVSDVGTTSIFAGPYDTQPPGPTTAYVVRSGEATVHTQQLYASVLCGEDEEIAIPGTSPPLCQLQISVHTTTTGTYSITATSSPGQLVALMAGEPTEWEVTNDQSAFFSFAIPDNLSNMTMIVTVTNGGSGLQLQAGTIGYSSLQTLWRLSQLPGADVVVFQLDWTDSQLPRYSKLAGTYGLVLSTTSGPVTFSIVYTVVNASVYSSTVVRLLNGQPQESVVAANGIGFYYWEAPSSGWPYVVTIDVEWSSGSGTLALAAVTGGPRVGPLPSDTNAVSLNLDGQYSISPGTWYGCDPTTVIPCRGYIVSVQINSREGEELGAYTITMTTSNFVRELYPNNPTSSNDLGVSLSNYYRTSTSAVAQSTSVIPHLLYALTVSSGVVLVYASNTTSSPNASNAQLTWTAVSDTAVLSYPLPFAQSAVYLTVTCTSTDDMPCAYTLQARQFTDNNNLYEQSSLNGDPALVLLPAGAIAWTAFPLTNYLDARVGSFVLQADAAAGSVSLYAACASGYLYNALRPNETYNSWQSASSPAVIELAGFNASAANCVNMLLGVRANGGQPAFVYVSMGAAGVEQRFSGMIAGLSTPAYPTSYFRYQLRDSDPSVVMRFSLTSIGGSGSGSNCTSDQLSLVVSDTSVYPDESVPSTYNFSAKPITLSPGMPIDMTIAITNYTKPRGSLHTGYYHVAVRSRVAGLQCRYQLQESGQSTAGNGDGLHHRPVRVSDCLGLLVDCCVLQLVHVLRAPTVRKQRCVVPVRRH